MNGFEAALRLLPQGIRERLEDEDSSCIEEIRLRCGRELCVVCAEESRSIKGCMVRESDIFHVLERATDSSMHSFTETVRQGFITAEGGIRVGLCGHVVYEALMPSAIREYSSLNIRIPHESSCGKTLFSEVYGDGLCSVLIVSPPGVGKTTCLRYLIRSLSESGRRVAVSDERYEIAAMRNSVPLFDLGENTDVLSGADKSSAVMLLLRAMNPNIIALDEVSSKDDCRAVAEAFGCGVSVLASAHGDSVQRMKNRESYRELSSLGLFDRAVEISIENGRRNYTVTELC